MLKPVNPSQIIDQQLVAMGTSRFDIAVRRGANNPPQLFKELFIAQVKSLIPKLAELNAAGHYIFVRPFGSHGLTLISGLTNRQVSELHTSDFIPAVEVQYAHDLYQVWFKHDRKLSPEQSQQVAKQLARMIGVDPDKVQWDGYGFLAGFYIHHTNEGTPKTAKPCQLTYSSGSTYTEAKSFLDTLLQTAK